MERGDPAACWLSIGPTDNDPVVLWWAIIDSMRTVLTGFGGDFRDRLLTAGEAALDDIVAAVADEPTKLVERLFGSLARSETEVHV